ncbi:DUF1311 domain-containing protein [Chitinophaga agrisoli]|uniref:DUF1311 domain-containing protein n=1 Tax=Chitinophaga agrisoli TaxID=2607653 RepID=A0A5B2W384_9BACT|nr:lysozyme inhibitor LprI family protein [Chitinophaga agrisoli]KAA2244966.1 DUF1311 domain-containing protein [Chitinophaga agrisoli]
MKKVLFFLPLLLCLKSFAQTKQAVIDSLESNYQRCLSKSQYMYGCALEYYRQMDSMMDNIYRQLYTSLDTNRRRSLKVEQVQWEEKKEAYFKLLDTRVEKLHKKTMAGLDDQAISTDHKAAYIKDRVNALLVNYRHYTAG